MGVGICELVRAMRCTWRASAMRLFDGTPEPSRNLVLIVMLGPGKATPQAIDVFVEIGRHVLPKRIECGLDAFATGKLCRRHEVRIPGHQNDHVGLPLQGDRGYVMNDSHVQAFPAQCRREIIVRKVLERDVVFQQSLLGPVPREPGTAWILAYFTQPDGMFGLAVQGCEQPFTKLRLGRPRVVDGLLPNRCLRLAAVRSRIVVEGAVQETIGVRDPAICLGHLFQVTENQPVDRGGHRARAVFVNVRTHVRQMLEQVPSINEDRGEGHLNRLKKRPRGFGLAHDRHHEPRMEARRTAKGLMKPNVTARCARLDTGLRACRTCQFPLRQALRFDVPVKADEGLPAISEHTFPTLGSVPFRGRNPPAF